MPGSPLTPTAPTRRSPSKAATPPRKKVKNGSKLASSAGLRFRPSRPAPGWRPRRCAQPCRPCAGRSAACREPRRPSSQRRRARRFHPPRTRRQGPSPRPPPSARSPVPALAATRPPEIRETPGRPYASSCDQRHRHRHARLRLHGEGAFARVPEARAARSATPGPARGAGRTERRGRRGRRAPTTATSAGRRTGATSSRIPRSACSTTAAPTRSTPSRRSPPPRRASTCSARSHSAGMRTRATRSGGAWRRPGSSTCAASTTASCRRCGSPAS